MGFMVAVHHEGRDNELVYAEPAELASEHAVVFRIERAAPHGLELR